MLAVPNPVPLPWDSLVGTLSLWLPQQFWGTVRPHGATSYEGTAPCRTWAALLFGLIAVELVPLDWEARALAIP